MTNDGVVRDWLRSLGLARYTQSFLDNGYDDLDVCRQIGTPDLDAIGVLDPDDRRRILEAVGCLSERTDLQPPGLPVYFTLENPDYGPSGAAAAGAVSVASWSSGVDDVTSLTDGDGREAVSPLTRPQLVALLRERLAEDAVRLTEQPYVSENGELNNKALMQLALRYAGALNTHTSDVIDCLQQFLTPFMPTSLISSCPNTGSSELGPPSADVCSRTRCASEASGPSDGADGSSYDVPRKGSFGSSLGRFLRTVTSRRSAGRKYTYRQHEGDLSASEITMNEEDRIQLMLLVKEGKISVQEAIDTVKKYRKLALDDDVENVSDGQTVQRESLSAFSSPVSSPSHQSHHTFRTDFSCSDIQPSSSSKSKSKFIFSSPFFARKGQRSAKDGRQSLGILHRCRAENMSTSPRKAWSPPPLPPLPHCSGAIVESLSAEFAYKRKSSFPQHRSPLLGAECDLPLEDPSAAVSMVRKSRSLHSSAAALHQLTAMLDLEGHPNGVADADLDVNSARSPKRHTPPSGSTPESQLPKRQFVSSSPPVLHEYHRIVESATSSPDGCLVDQHARAGSPAALRTARDGPGHDQKCDLLSVKELSVSASVPEHRAFHGQPEVDRVHSSMDSLINSASGGGCGISSSSSHSSMSVDEEPSPKSISRVRAHRDSTLTTKDCQDALSFKKGDIICLLTMSESGIWTGIFNNHVGTFLSADVETIHDDGTLLPTPRHGRPSKARRGLRRSKPRTVEELLVRLGLQKLVGMFITSGFTTLEEFSELDEVDLDELQVTQAEDRAKLLTAAQLLVDCENTGSDASHDVVSRSSSQSPARRSHDASCQTLSFTFESPSMADVTDTRQASRSSRHFSDTSSDDQELHCLSHDDVEHRRSDVHQLPGTQTLVSSRASCTDDVVDGRRHHEHSSLGNGSVGGNDLAVTRRPQVNGEGKKAALAAHRMSGSSLSLSQHSVSTSGRSSSPSVRTAQVRQLSTGLPKPASGYSSWKYRSSIGGQVPEIHTVPSLTKQHAQLVSSMWRLLEADGIDLASYPYTHQSTGESGIPTSLIRHYADVLHCGRSEAVLAVEECRQKSLAVAPCINRQEYRHPAGSVATALPVGDNSDSVHEFLSALGLSVYTSNFIARDLTTVSHLHGLTALDFIAIGVSSAHHVDRLLGALEAIAAMSDGVQYHAGSQSSRAPTSMRHSIIGSPEHRMPGTNKNSMKPAKASSVSRIVDKV